MGDFNAKLEIDNIGQKESLNGKRLNKLIHENKLKRVCDDNVTYVSSRAASKIDYILVSNPYIIETCKTYSTDMYRPMNKEGGNMKKN